MWSRAIGCLVTLMLSLLVVLQAADAQQARKVPRLGVLRLGSPPAEPDWKQRSPFWQELYHLGWMEGKNITVEYRWAEGNVDRLPALADELVRLPVDVMVVADTRAIHAAQQATTTIPIVILSIGDPVTGGFATSLARPGGNITGVGGLVAEVSGKLFALLTEAVPGVTRVAVLVDPRNPTTESMVRDVESAAQVLGVQLQVLEVRDPGQFERAFDAATQKGAGALLVLSAILFGSNQSQIAALAVKRRLPAIFSQRPFAEAGGLMAYGPRMPDLWGRVAALVDKILKGAQPADLPVEQPMRFELVINLKTAAALGLTIPPTLLFQADEVIK
jgi:putative ABC transport system substrate-binding protein